MIEEIYRQLEINLDESVFQLSEQQKKEITTARGEIEGGEGISSEQVDKELDEWLRS